MDLYFSPLACSLATRISLYEAGADARFIEVDPKTKRIVADGSDYLTVYPLGMVPAIRMDDGALLTENAAILQYVAERFPERTSRRRAASRARGCSSGSASSAPNCTRDCSCRCSTTSAGRHGGEHAAQGRIAARLSQRLSRPGANSCSTISPSPTPIFHGAELEHGDAGEVRSLPGDSGLLQRACSSARASRRRSAEELALYRAEVARHKAAA